MRLISWNCNCAFRKKNKLLTVYNPDVLVCPESESPEQLTKYAQPIKATSHVWIGNSASKGLSVFTFNNYKAELAPFYNQEFQYVLPLIISRGKEAFLLLAVWTQGTRSTYNGYVVQACKAIMYYLPYFDSNTIIAGDFNSNKMWDNHCKRRFNHSRLVELLARHNLVSLYHLLSHEQQGAETTPTIFLHKHQDRPYHIDYIFANPHRKAKIKTLGIGNYNDWITASDHMPLYLETA